MSGDASRNFDAAARYAREDLVARFGEPIIAERPTAPVHGITEILAFECGCRAVGSASGYSVAVPCERHGTTNVIHISDRRCGAVALDYLDFEATGVLGSLIEMQQDAERDASGCVDVTFEAELFRDYRDGLRQLLRAGLLRLEDDGRYRLTYFTCFDSKTGEWY